MTLLSPASGDQLSARTVPAGFVGQPGDTVYAANETSDVNDRDFWNACWGLEYHARYQLGRAWGLAPVTVKALPKGQTAVPKGGIVLHFADTLDVSGALGYHDEDGAEVPYAKIGTKVDPSVAWTAVGAHELDELLVDLHVNLLVLNEAKLEVLPYEVGDPAQGHDFDVGAPEGRTTGVLVADFALPNWFDANTPATAKTSYRGACVGPFNVCLTGYHAYIDLRDPLSGGRPNWQSVFGQDHVKATNPE